MSRREDIDNAIWSDPDFEALSPKAKLLYIWSFTNQRCGMAGLYKFSSQQAVLETGMTIEQVDVALSELESECFVDCQGSALWVRARVKHLRTRTPQIARSIAKDLDKLSADHPLRLAFLEKYANAAWLREELGPLKAGESPRTEGLPDPPAGTSTRTSTTPSRTSNGRFQGKGKGLGNGVEGSGEKGAARLAWAAEHLPDLPAELVCLTLTRFDHGKREHTPELVRQDVLAHHPHLTVHSLPGGKVA